MKKSIKLLVAMFFMLIAVAAVGGTAEASISQTGATESSIDISWNDYALSTYTGWVIAINNGGQPQAVSGVLPISQNTYKFSNLPENTYMEVAVCYVKADGAVIISSTKVVKTVPGKVSKVKFQWGKTDYINMDIEDVRPYVYISPYGNTYNESFADGFKVVIKDLKGKTLDTYDVYSSDHPVYGYTGGNKYFKAPKKIVNKGMKCEITPYITMSDYVTKIYGDTVTKVVIPQAKITKNMSSGSQIKVTWKKVSGAQGYTIYRTSNKGVTLKKIKKVNKNTTSIYVKKSWMNGGLNSGKGILILANGVKVGKKKYNSYKSYYTYVW